MSLGDPFNATLENSQHRTDQIIGGVQGGINTMAGVMQKEKQKQDTYNMLLASGMITEKTVPPTDDELKKGLEEGAKKAGISQVNWMESDDPAENRKSLEDAYSHFGIPMPQEKKVINYNLNPGTKYNPSTGDLEFNKPSDYSDTLRQLGIMKYESGVEDKSNARQDKLEKNASDMMNKIVNSRSGGLGLQDSKVNQAIDLRRLVDASKDPTTGEYKIAPAFQTELVLGLAKLVSPNGNVGIDLEKELATKTAQEGLAKMAIYFGADPKEVGGSPQNVIKYYLDAIDRQGKTAEDIRDNYLTGIKKRADFQGLSEDSKNRIFKSNLGSSFKEYLKSGNIGSAPDGGAADTAPTSGGSGGKMIIRNPQTGHEMELIDGKWQDRGQ